MAPIWGPFWDHVGASGQAFSGQENRVILKTLFDRIWVPLWAAQCAQSIVNNSKIEGSQFLVEGSFFDSILTLFGVPLERILVTFWHADYLRFFNGFWDPPRDHPNPGDQVRGW